MKKTGFTLLELLAVIVILAVIALIATPLVMNAISDAKDGALKETARNLIKTAQLEAGRLIISGEMPTDIDAFLNNLEYKGEKVDAIYGNLKDGKIMGAIYKDGKCVYQTSTDQDVILVHNKTKEECASLIGK